MQGNLWTAAQPKIGSLSLSHPATDNHYDIERAEVGSKLRDLSSNRAGSRVQLPFVSGPGTRQISRLSCHLCERRFGLWQPEPHLHISVHHSQSGLLRGASCPEHDPSIPCRRPRPNRSRVTQGTQGTSVTQNLDYSLNDHAYRDSPGPSSIRPYCLERLRLTEGQRPCRVATAMSAHGTMHRVYRSSSPVLRSAGAG